MNILPVSFEGMWYIVITGHPEEKAAEIGNNVILEKINRSHREQMRSVTCTY
jgi:hypothetical protein